MFGQARGVNRSPFSLSETARLIVAVAGGLMWAAAFPKIELAGLAWLAPGVILFAALGSASPFRIGYVAGFISHLASLYWLLLIPVRFYPILGWLGLSAYLSLYPAAWCWLCVKAGGRVVNTAGESPPGNRLLWTLFCAVAWVALEMVRARFLTGFPWNPLGVSQYRILPLIQMASVAGVYGVAFLVVWFSVSLLLAGQALVREPMNRLRWMGDIAPPLLVAVLCCAWGFRKIAASVSNTSRKLKIALVQPSIPQTMIWNEADNMTRFQQLLRLSELALATKPDLMIWPEAGVPNLPRYDRDVYDPIADLVRRHHVWLIFGADDAEPRRPRGG